jgi:hypothetical protein
MKRIQPAPAQGPTRKRGVPTPASAPDSALKPNLARSIGRLRRLYGIRERDAFEEPEGGVTKEEVKAVRDG